jgi:hypothetical protein
MSILQSLVCTVHVTVLAGSRQLGVSIGRHHPSPEKEGELGVESTDLGMLQLYLYTAVTARFSDVRSPPLRP